MTLSAEKVIIAAQIIVVCAVTWGLLELVRHVGGRGALWTVGLPLLFLSGFAFFWRWRKKV